MPTSSNAEGAAVGGACHLCGAAESLCEGLGMVRYDVPLGHSHFGKLFRCPNHPVELDTERQDRLRRLSNLGALAEKRFDDFYIDSPAHSPREQESLRAAYNAATRFAENPEGWLLLEGGYGCGKTHLAAAIGNARIAHGDEVLFVTSPDLLDHLRVSYGDAEQGYDETFERLKGVRLLILDDLGVENPSPWAKEKLFQLLNHRYTQRLPTVITTNAELERLDPRLRSRMQDVDRTSRVIITAPDYRSMTDNARSHLSSALGTYRNYTFDNFDLVGNLNQDERQNITTVTQAARQYAESARDQWFIIAGKPGTGKTHLAAAIANARQERGAEVFFITVADLMDDLRTTFNPSSASSFDQRFNQVKNVGLLVLDDINVGGSSEWAKEKLFQLIDYRYVTRKPTVFTLSDLDRVSERVQVRLLDPRLTARYELTVPPYVMRGRRR